MEKEIYVIVSIDSNYVYNLGIDKETGESVYSVSDERFDENGLEKPLIITSEWEKRGYSKAKYYYV